MPQWLREKYCHLKCYQKMTTNVGGKMPKSGVKNVFSAENERGEGITGRERVVRY